MTNSPRRRTDLSPDAFRQYWRDIHGPIVARHALTLGIKRYVPVYAIDAAPAGGRPEAFDGIGEIWIESIKAFQEAAATPERAVAVGHP